MNFSTPPFSTLSSTDSFWLLLFLLLTFLVGFFIGRVSLASRLKNLKKKRQQQETELAALQTQLSDRESALQSARERQEFTEAQLAESNANNQNLQQQLRLQQESALQSANISPLERLNTLEQKMNRLEAENQELQLAMETLQGGVEEIEIDLQQEDFIPETYDSPSPSEKTALAKAALKKHFGNKIPLADASQKDALQLLDGIGPFIETQLNGIGIYTFKQISCFDAEIIELVTEAIRFFPGRIAKDQWKEQATSRLS